MQAVLANRDHHVCQENYITKGVTMGNAIRELRGTLQDWWRNGRTDLRGYLLSWWQVVTGQVKVE